MKKTAWVISHNGKEGRGYKEYDKTTYSCVLDDVWVVTEIPLSKLS